MALMTISFYSHCLGRTVPMRALVPIDASDIAMDSPVKPLPALYLLHGLHGSENDWLTYTRVALWARQKGVAIFCPAGENSFYVNQEAQGKSYLRFLGEELPAFTRRMFPLSHKREETFIAGLSMGGFGALNAALSYPQVFGKAAALSAALRPWKLMAGSSADRTLQPSCATALFGEHTEAWDILTLAKACGADMPALWMACGDEDPLLPENRAFAQGMAEAGLPLHFDITPGNHNWDFWDREIQRVVAWMMEAN